MEKTKLKAFVSHSGKDKPFVRKLKEDLNFNGIDTWVDEDELNVGDKLLDSLMLGLGSSSHFLIVLSDNIKGSNWVEAELDEAIKNYDAKTLNKIIPVLLKDTDIPKKLEKLFRADFSKITFTLKEDKVNHPGEEYDREFRKILNAIKKSDSYKLDDKTKDKIIDDTERPKSDSAEPGKVIGLFRILGFMSKESKSNLIKMVTTKSSPTAPIRKMASDKIIPICLPNIIKPVFGKRTAGEKIYVTTPRSTKKYVGHFCSYLKNSQNVIIPKEIRAVLNIKDKKVHTVEFDGPTSTIKIVS